MLSDSDACHNVVSISEIMVGILRRKEQKRGSRVHAHGAGRMTQSCLYLKLKGYDAMMNGNSETLRAIEISRLKALVDADIETAEKLHAEDFQLITPGGSAMSKAEYLSGVASGVLDYRIWEVDSQIDVRLFEGVAIIRYRSILQMVYYGDDLGQDKYWHTDSYEWRDGRWQVVWSHATKIK